MRASIKGRYVKTATITHGWVWTVEIGDEQGILLHEGKVPYVFADERDARDGLATAKSQLDFPKDWNWAFEEIRPRQLAKKYVTSFYVDYLEIENSGELEDDDGI